jgi:hypothetical protein
METYCTFMRIQEYTILDIPCPLLLADLSPAYVRDLLLARLQWMREVMNTVRSIHLFSLIMPRIALSGETVPGNLDGIVIMHGSHVLRQSTIETLLNGTVGCTATGTPIVHLGPDTEYDAVTLHPM